MRKLLAIILTGLLIVPLCTARSVMAEQAWTTGGTENYVAKYSSSISTLTASSMVDNGVLVNVLGANGVMASTFTSVQTGFVAGALYTNIRSYFRMVGTAAFWGYNAYPGLNFWELNSSSRSGSIIYQRTDDYPSGGAYNGHTVMQWTQITSTHTTNEMMTWDWNTGQMCLGLGHNAANAGSLCRGKLSVGGNVNVSTGYGYLMNGVDINTTGTLSNVAYKGQNNNFTNQQVFQDSVTAYGQLVVIDGDIVISSVSAGLKGIRYMDGTYQTTATPLITMYELKTSSSECSALNSQNFCIMPGGEYAFYPRVKMSDTTNSYSATIMAGVVSDYYRGSMANLAGFTSFQTMASVYASSPGKTIYLMQRYITASGTDWWIFLCKDKKTGDIVGAYSAADHPSYGNGGDYLKLSHPFPGYDEKTQEIVLVDKGTTVKLQSMLTGDKSLLSMVHEDFKVDDIDEKYVPRHSGGFSIHNNVREPVMVKTIPEYIHVRKLVRLTNGEKKARRARWDKAAAEITRMSNENLARESQTKRNMEQIPRLLSEIEILKSKISILEGKRP